jgi:hypothetical protein
MILMIKLIFWVIFTFNQLFFKVFVFDLFHVICHVDFFLSRIFSIECVDLCCVHCGSVVFFFVLFLRQTLLLSLDNLRLWYEFLYLIISFLELAFVIEEIVLVNILDIMTLYIHAFIFVSTNSHEVLVTSAFVSETIAYEHTDTMWVVFCSVVESSTTIVLIDKINGVQTICFYIHTTEVFMRSLHGNLLNHNI